jgi:hypothetical protein
MDGLSQFILKTGSYAFRKATAKGGLNYHTGRGPLGVMGKDDRPRGHAQARGRESIPSWLRFGSWRTVQRGRMLDDVNEVGD